MDQPPEAPAPPPRRARRRLTLFLLLLLGLACGGVYAATAVVVRVDNVLLPGVDLEVPQPVTRVVPGLAATPVEGSPGTTRINVLLLGIDRRPHHDPKVDGPPNSDSMHILSLDPVTRTATALALPRDLYVEMPSPQKKGEFWEARINAAYRFGEEHKYPGGGAAYARHVVEYTFHIPIDYYAVIDWPAFADVIDALGGIDITVPTEMRRVEGFNPRDGNSFRITIPAGPLHMDAITALAYARFRDDDENDFGRIRRQQEVMRAALDRAMQLGWLGQGPQLYNRFRGAIDTDLALARLPGVLNLGRLIGQDKVTMVSLAGENKEAVRPVITPWGEDVLVPVWEVLAPIVRGALDDRTLRGEAARVTVVNATGRRGQDTRAVAYLSRFALQPGQIAAAPPGTPAPSANATTVTYTGEASETAHRVAEWLGVASNRVTRIEGLPDVLPTVTVTLGPDIRLPDDERFNTYRLR